jgi:hypothetical protein
LSLLFAIIGRDYAGCCKFGLMRFFAPFLRQSFGFPLLHGGMGKDMIDPALTIAHKLDMSRPQIRRDLLLEKGPAFADSPLYRKVFALADDSARRPLPRQAMPQITLKSPKISRRLTTEWFARRVGERYRNCLARGWR